MKPSGSYVSASGTSHVAIRQKRRHAPAPQTPGAQQPKGKQTQRCSPAHVRLVLAVECPCVMLGVLGRQISLSEATRSSGSTTTNSGMRNIARTLLQEFLPALFQRFEVNGHAS